MDRDQEQDAREAELDRREAALTARVKLAEDILAAAEARDHDADHRDDAAAQRDRTSDLAAFVATDGSYGDDAPARRNAALDRLHSKGDRFSSADDRLALSRDVDPEEAPEP